MCGFISSYPFLWWFILFCWENNKSFRCQSVGSQVPKLIISGSGEVPKLIISGRWRRIFILKPLKDKCGQCQFPYELWFIPLVSVFVSLYRSRPIHLAHWFRFLLRLRQIIQMRSLSEISLSYQHSLENLQRLGWPVSFQQILGRGHLSADLPVTTEHQIFISNPTWVFRNLKHIRPFFCVSTFCSSRLHNPSVLLHALFIAHLLVVLVHSLVASTTMSLLLSTKKNYYVPSHLNHAVVVRVA